MLIVLYNVFQWEKKSQKKAKYLGQKDEASTPGPTEKKSAGMCMQGQVYALDSHFLVIVYKEAFVYKNIEKITLMLVKFSNFFILSQFF